jgi:hypothetical protein
VEKPLNSVRTKYANNKKNNKNKGNPKLNQPGVKPVENGGRRERISALVFWLHFRLKK